ncbi:DUF3405 domain-containing protein [Pedobacter sp. MR2016-19]|uniref:beta-1,6-N-acetylglucosaminyltransferase n=1 Tax=Pedobacter sp. MR2016-19 TaxID=2780089 RepID=UPI001875D35E|nr:beta-1,6-N-acetylglucosaminyltransferase [Pedobacter sp. MR2016-19]MBE5320740.1 DUF3405 domain-containing protein [Pedobacter sp. MR2016-19]
MILISYLILAHENPKQLSRLIKALRSDNCNFVVHIDARIAIDGFASYFENDAQVFFLQNREESQWGSFGLVDATLSGMKFIQKNSPETSRVVLLSGSDYPLKSVRHIERFLEANPKKIFIDYFTIPHSKWNNGGKSRFPNFEIIQENMKLYGGSQWWSFPYEVMEFVLSFLAFNPEFISYFKLVTIPDESFFQTLLFACEEPFIVDNLVNNSLRLIKWDYPFNHPRILTCKDEAIIKRSKHLFARKFKPGISDSILSFLDKNTVRSGAEDVSDSEIKSGATVVNQVVAFLTNKNDIRILGEYNRLKTQITGLSDITMLYHKGQDKPLDSELLNIAPYVFSDEIYEGLGYQTMRHAELDGSNHFPLIKFFRDFPEYDFYWYVEDDVRFLGGWDVFFSYFLNNGIDDDFLSSHIRDYEDEPDWYWWSSLKNEQSGIEKEYIRSFNPIFRISRSALAYIDQCHSEGWSGHFEVLLPTLLKSAGFSISEFGGEGKYVLPGCKNFFYTASQPDNYGGMLRGSMRYRPFITEGEMTEPLIYHPVKFSNPNN